MCQEDDVLYLCEFSTILYDTGLVQIYYYVALRDKRDEKRALPRSVDMLHFLDGGQVV